MDELIHRLRQSQKTSSNLTGESDSLFKDAADAIEKLKGQLLFGNQIIHNMVVANQSAYIAHAAGKTDNAMDWIENGLEGPGHLPDNPDKKTAQQWYDDNVVEYFDTRTQ